MSHLYIAPRDRRLIGAGVLALLLLCAYILLVTASASSATQEGVTVRALGNMRIRDAPSLQGQRIAGMGWGDQATLLAVSGDGDWYQIDYNGLVGWSSAEWFEVVAGDVNARRAAPASAGNTATVAQAVGNVRIREAPGLAASRVGLVPWGGVVTVLSVDPTGDWYEIEYGGLRGWSARDWYRVQSGDVSALVAAAGAGPQPPVPANARGLDAPIPQAAPAVESTVSAPSSGTVAQALGNVRLRQGPGLGERQIGLVGWGDEVQVLGLDASRQWLRVAYDGLVGWTAAEWYRVTAGDPTAISGGGAASVASVTAQALGNVRLREGPGLGNARVGLVPWGTVVVVLDVDASGDWYQITLDGVTGWTFAEWYRVLSGEPGALR